MPLQPNFVANGNITPSRFVKIDTTYTQGNRIIQCTATTDLPIGISQPGSIYAAGTPAYTGNAYAAVAGDDCMVFQPTETAKLELGGTVTVGAYLQTDTSGRGVAQTSNIVSAIAMQAGILGDIIPVYVIPTIAYP